jgi:hypothetical protein
MVRRARVGFDGAERWKTVSPTSHALAISGAPGRQRSRSWSEFVVDARPDTG